MAIKDLGLRIATVGLLLGSLLLVSEPVSAQWIFAAKHIEGRINQLTQDDQNGKPTAQMATVVLNVPASKVYATAINLAKQNQAITIVSQDATNLKLKVSENNKSVALKVVPLNDQSSEIMISASASADGDASSTSAAANAILKICTQMNKKCSLGAN
ncbi:hypothetical protein MCEZE4_00213 [Burkholderiaceae bacterium]|jgi:hypothetical protein